MTFSGRSLFIVLVVLATSLIAGSSAISAQGIQPKYNVGDRVEVDYIMQSDPAKAIWRKGTVIKVDMVAVQYVIQVDPLPGQLPVTRSIPIRDYAEKWIRSAGGGAAPAIASDKLRVDANGTVLADRDLLDCANMTQPRARNGGPPPTELAKKLIRCLYEKPSVPGSDGATTMDIVTFAPGAPHRWNVNSDSGAGGTAQTMVYPFRVKWNQKTFYRSYNQVQTGGERIFDCYVNVDVWFCGSAQFIKDGEKQQIMVKR
ncbi:MAG TPA: hypothetical protein VGI80_04765 [Pyrinomonadaceae bacterium]|jgi:hypothetical protein